MPTFAERNLNLNFLPNGQRATRTNTHLASYTPSGPSHPLAYSQSRCWPLSQQPGSQYSSRNNSPSSTPFNVDPRLLVLSPHKTLQTAFMNGTSHVGVNPRNRRSERSGRPHTRSARGTKARRPRRTVTRQISLFIT